MSHRPRARLLLVPALLAGALGIAKAPLAHAAPVAIASCTYNGLSTALTAGGAYTLPPGCTGTIVFPANSPITIPTGVTSSLDATGSGLVLSGNDASRLFVIQGTGSLSLTGLTLTHGAAPAAPPFGGAVFLDGVGGTGNFALTGGAITNSTADSGGANSQGFGGGIAVVNGGTLTLRDDMLSGNRAGTGVATSDQGFGGAIYIAMSVGRPATLTIVGGSFADNQAGVGAISGQGFGGAVYANSVDLAVSGARFTGNRAGTGGSTTNQGFGGAIYASGTRPVTMSGDTFAGNATGTGPGTATGNGFGGAAYLLAPTIGINDSTFSGNQAGSTSGQGGGLIAVGGAPALGFGVTLSGVAIYQNQAGTRGNGSGGGAYLSGSVSVSTSTIFANVAGSSQGTGVGSTGGGGLGLGVAPGGQPSVIDRTTIAGNRALGNPGPDGGAARGGGIYSDHALTITNSTIADNTALAGASTAAGNPGAHASGGGIYNSGQLALVSDTVTGNAATAGAPGPGGTVTASEGGGLYTAEGNIADVVPQPAALQQALSAPVRPDAPVAATATAKNTIIAANTADLGPDVYGPFVSGGYNLIGNPSIPGLTGTLQPTDKTGVAPQLGPLADNGGPRAGAPGATLPTLTERVLPGSPALDAVPAASCTDAVGAPLATDERGLVRPFGAGCEIGAYEASTLTFGGPLGTGATGCSLAVTFFSGGTAFALRTGSALNTLMSYLAIKGPAGTITGVPLVPRAGVPDTLTCTVPDPAALPSAIIATTVTVDAQVVASTNPAIARLSTVRVVATRTAATETVTVSAINPGGTTGATLYTLTPSVQPQSFVVRVIPSGPFSLPR